MSEFDDIINDFKATAYKPTTEEVLESEIKRVDGKVDTIEKELTEKIDETLAIVEEVKKQEGPAGYTPQKGVDYEDGKDYVLTPEDKEEIAKTIVVPIVEKVIIKELPIVTENKFEIIKEVALHETGEQTVEKINNLPLEDEYKIDASHIKNLPKSDSQVGGGLSRGVADRLYAPIGSSGGATSWGAITGTLSNQTDLQTALNAKAASLGADDNYVTDAQLVIISNTSGTNTGDQVGDGVTITGAGTIGDPFVSVGGGISESLAIAYAVAL